MAANFVVIIMRYSVSGVTIIRKTGTWYLKKRKTICLKDISKTLISVV